MRKVAIVFALLHGVAAYVAWSRGQIDLAIVFVSIAAVWSWQEESARTMDRFQKIHEWFADHVYAASERPNDEMPEELRNLVKRD